MKARNSIGRPGAVLMGMLAVLTVTPARAQLAVAGAQLLQQGVDGFPDTAEESDGLGRVLAAGDFDGDGKDDLAIGAPIETVFGGAYQGGQVTVVYGATGGLDPASGELWSIDWTAHGASGFEDHLGNALAAGDFDDDGYVDLAIGIARRNVPGSGGTAYDGGAVLVLYGGASGLTAVGSQLWHQGADGVEGVAESYDGFGTALATGDFNGDGFADLAIGVPDEDVGAVEDSGAVNVIYGSPSGLSTDFAAVADQIWVQGDLGLSMEEAGDGFGRTLAAGDFDGDGRDDLAVGAPTEDVGAVVDAGAVSVLFGSGLGLTDADARFVTQEIAVPAEAETEDFFGSALAAGDLDGDGDAELAIGAIYEDVESPVLVGSAGSVHVLRGTASGFEATLAWKIERSDAGSAPTSFDHFGGMALAIGSFDAGRIGDLAVGAHGVDVDGAVHAGSVFAFAGRAAGEPLFQVELSQSGTVPGLPEPDDYFATALAVGDFDGNGFDDLAAGVPGDSAGGAEDAGVVNVLFSSGLFRDGFERGDAARWSDAVAN